MLIKYEFLIEVKDEADADILYHDLNRVIGAYEPELCGGWTPVDTDTEEADNGDED